MDTKFYEMRNVSSDFSAKNLGITRIDLPDCLAAFGFSTYAEADEDGQGAKNNDLFLAPIVCHLFRFLFKKNLISIHTQQ